MLSFYLTPISKKKHLWDSIDLSPMNIDGTKDVNQVCNAQAPTCVCSSVKPTLNYSFEKAIKRHVYVKVITLYVLDHISLTTLLSMKILLPMGCVKFGNFG